MMSWEKSTRIARTLSLPKWTPLPMRYDVNIRGFPTLKLFKKGDNKVVEYDGARDLDGFVKFLDALEDTKDAEPTKKDEL